MRDVQIEDRLTNVESKGKLCAPVLVVLLTTYASSHILDMIRLGENEESMGDYGLGLERRKEVWKMPCRMYMKLYISEVQDCSQ